MDRTDRNAAPDLWDTIGPALELDDETAARGHLAAGYPIYYAEADTPEGLLVKEHPDGRRELVRHHRDRDEVVGPL